MADAEPTSKPAASRPAVSRPEPSRPQEVALDEVVVLAEKPSLRSPSISRVGRQELRRRRLHTVVEALEQEVAFNATFGRRGERTFTLRGFDQRQVSVLIDGAPGYVPFDGQVDLSYLPAQLVERITVVKGPASVLYGPNGLGGAVNVVTRRPGAGPLGGATLEQGLGHALSLSAVHSLDLGAVAYTLYGGWRKRDAWPLPADYAPSSRENGVLRENSDEGAFFAGGAVSVALAAEHELRANVSYVDAERGVPPDTLAPAGRYWRFSAWRSLGSNIGHRGRYFGRRLELEELLYARVYQNLVDSYDDATYSSQIGPAAFSNWFRDHVLGGRVRARLALGESLPTELRIWVSAQHEQHAEEGSGDDQPAITRGLLTSALEGEMFLGDRFSVLVAGQLDAELPGQSISDDLSSRVAFGGLLALRYRPQRLLALGLSAARRSRFPTLRDRFSLALGTREPNLDLGPEVAWHFAFEASYAPWRWLRVAASIYDAEIDGLISFVALGGGLEQLQNVGSARFFGSEIEIKLQPMQGLELSVAYHFLHARRTEGDDALVAYRPAHRAMVGLRWRPRRWIEIGTRLRMVAERHYEHPVSASWEVLEPYASWEARVSVHPTRHMTLWLRGTNLLDGGYEGKAGFPEPGRMIWLGLELRYDPPG
ncbi:MAG: TonB-dependent receptor [Deltaproteobacteria bacterium]|nr:TonB-dependent receptor [Deltaproteobacteria bacterium]